MDFGEILGKIGFDARVALFNTVNFLLVLLLLKKVIFGKVVDIIKHRQDTIAQNNAAAIKLEGELKNAEAKSFEIIAEANRKASEVISENQRKAEELAGEIKSRTQQEIDLMKREADAKIEKQKQGLVSEVKTKAVDLTIAATEAVLKEKLDDKSDKDRIVNFIQSVKVVS